MPAVASRSHLSPRARAAVAAAVAAAVVAAAAAVAVVARGRIEAGDRVDARVDARVVMLPVNKPLLGYGTTAYQAVAAETPEGTG